MSDVDDAVIAATRNWLEKAVIGLGLCPFAARAHLQGQIRYAISAAHSEAALIEDLSREAQLLQAATPEVCETVLLIHPGVLADFADYNEFLTVADDTLLALELEGELQIASFHPRYRFAGTAENDIENFTNRSPYPMLQLLRESSVTRAVETFPDVDGIGDRNIATLRKLGSAGWERLWVVQ